MMVYRVVVFLISLITSAMKVICNMFSPTSNSYQTHIILLLQSNSRRGTQIRALTFDMGAPSIFVGLIFWQHPDLGPKSIPVEHDRRDPLVIVSFFFLYTGIDRSTGARWI
jgi:hypothetical protein